MRTLLYVSAFLLASFGFLSAQQAGSANASDRSKASTFEGCLQSSESGFTLKTNHQTYEVTGDTAQLNNLSGKEVRITGKEGSASDVSTGAPGNSGLSTSNPSAGAAPTIQANKVNKISDQCRK